MAPILAVGPRELPERGTVTVWVDCGSTSGQQLTVSVRDLTVAEMDDGRGDSAIYTLRTYVRPG